MDTSVHNNSDFTLINKGKVQYLTIPAFEKSGMVRHGFSTRMGGVSTGECSSLNLGFKRRDDKESVLENFRIFGDALGIDRDSMVMSDQVHEDRIAFAGSKDRGKGITKDSDIKGIDGLITNEPEVSLVTIYADCVPLFFLDPVNRAVGLSHAGWRGTVAKIASKTIDKMGETFGTDPADCITAIGPSIGNCCFEVDSPVYDEFRNAFEFWEDIITDKQGNKYHIDLWKANSLQMQQKGVKKDNISVANICTCCRRDLFFSHRRDKGRTGSLAAIIMLI